MTVLVPSIRTSAPLQIERSGIVFHERKPGIVHIELTIENQGVQTTPATSVVVQAAPLGAFVKWRPLTTLRLPPLAPGASCVLETEASRPRVAALGTPAKVSARELLTALDANPRDFYRASAGRPSLPADLFELVGHTNPQWAGNLNVFIGDCAVERHVANALRIHPGQLNTAFFVVGSGPDDYAFELFGAGAYWDAALYSLDGRHDLRPRPDEQTPINERDWVHIDGEDCLALVVRPPEDCDEGTVAVEVTKRSTGAQAVVEFSLDASASGPGCLVVC